MAWLLAVLVKPLFVFVILVLALCIKELLRKVIPESRIKRALFRERR